MNSTAADFLTLAGMVITAIGAGRAATSVILKEDDALAIGVARFSSEHREENLKLPAVQNLLKASRGAQQGFWLIVAGTALQIIPIGVQLLS